MLDCPGLLPHGRLVERIYAQVAIAWAERVLDRAEGCRVEAGTPARLQHHFLVELVEVSILVVDVLATQVGQTIICPRHGHHAQVRRRRRRVASPLVEVITHITANAHFLYFF